MGFDSFVHWPEKADMTQLLRWAGEVVRPPTLSCASVTVSPGGAGNRDGASAHGRHRRIFELEST